MSATCISPLPQQCLLQQEPSQYFPTATAVPAPAGAFPVLPHCHSSARSRRSSINISPLPQQCLLPQERHLYFPTAAAVPAPAGAPSISPHCRSSVYSRRSAIYISPLPQQYLPSPPPSSPHAATAAHFFLQDAAASLQAVSSIPSALKPCNFLGGLLATIWLLSHDKHFLGSFWVRAKCRARTPLPGRGEYPGLGNYYRARSPLLGQHAKYAYRLFSSLLSKCELVK